MAEMKDRRRNTRWDIEKPVRFRFDEQDQGHECVARDISAGGLCLYSRYELRPETQLDLEIEMPDEPRQILVKGRVSWSQRVERPTLPDRSKKTGIEFIDLTNTDAERIFRYAFRHQHHKLMERWWNGV